MPWARRLCIRWGPSFPPPKKGAQSALQFLAHVYEGSLWLVRLLFTRWQRRRKGYNDGCQGGVIGIDNMEHGGKYESFTLLGATKDGCKIF